MLTNLTTPELLSEEALAKIEAKRTRNEVTNRDIVALCQTVRALREKHTRLAEVSGEWANLLDRIRLWSKCADGYPLDEHINNIATQLAQLTQTLTAIEACKNPKCGHCMALLRTTRRG